MKINNSIRRFCGISIGIVFAMAGLLKLADPVGTGLIFNGYFDFFKTDFLKCMSEWLGIALSLVETITGIALITGVFRKAVAIIASLLISFFTFITLILVIFAPTIDCGCFGEAIHLTHLETFIKNLILCLLAAIAFIPYKNLGKAKKKKYVMFIVIALATILFSIYSTLFIPITDFTAFTYGSELLSADELISQQEYSATFIYEKEGIRKEFSLENIPDSTWTFVESNTKLATGKDISEFEYLPILSFTDAEGNYMDKLAMQGKVMVISLYDTDLVTNSKNGQERLNKIHSFYENAKKAGFKPILLSSSHINKGYFSDYKTLISLNRSNGGATYFNDGLLVSKWSFINYPNNKELKKIAKNNAEEYMLDTCVKRDILKYASLLIVFCIIAFL